MFISITENLAIHLLLVSPDIFIPVPSLCSLSPSILYLNKKKGKPKTKSLSILVLLGGQWEKRKRSQRGTSVATRQDDLTEEEMSAERKEQDRFSPFACPWLPTNCCYSTTYKDAKHCLQKWKGWWRWWRESTKIYNRWYIAKHSIAETGETAGVLINSASADSDNAWLCSIATQRENCWRLLILRLCHNYFHFNQPMITTRPVKLSHAF